MYIASDITQAVSQEWLQAWEAEQGLRLPDSYSQFIQTFGPGTYRGLLQVELPDEDRLREFADYELWEHPEEGPITREQIRDCCVLASTINGDFIAVSRHVEGLLWFPRHADEIRVLSVMKGDFTQSMDHWLGAFYPQADPERYYEPWQEQGQHEFYLMDAEKGALKSFAETLRATFAPELCVENEYTCKLFYRAIGGYVRFNYAYGREVAVSYALPGELLSNITSMVVEHGGERASE